MTASRLDRIVLAGAAGILVFGTGYATGHGVDPPHRGGGGADRTTDEEQLYADLEVPRPPEVIPSSAPPAPR